MLRLAVVLLTLAATSFAVTLPRPTGDVPFVVPGKGPDNLTNYKNKVVLAVIFITTCPHCQATTKLLSGIQKDYKAMGLQVIELAFRPDDDDAAIKKFVETYKPNFPVGKIDPNLMAEFGELTAEMRPTVPILFMIDRQGMVRAQYMNQDPFMQEPYQDQNIRAKLLQYLAPGGKLPGKPAATKPADPKPATTKK